MDFGHAFAFGIDEVVDPELAVGDGNPLIGADPGGALAGQDELGKV